MNITRDESIKKVFSQLDQVTQDVQAGNIGVHEVWGGADVGVLFEPIAKPWESFYPEPRWVITPSAAEVSWLFFELYWEVFPDWVDYLNKYEFVGRLANAANRYLDQVDGVESLPDLLLAIIAEARIMAKEMERHGDIATLPVAMGNMIHDDLVQEAQGGRA